MSIPSPRPRVLFLINDLRMGGAERSLVNFVNHLRRVRADVVLIESAADLLAELRPGIELFTLDGGGSAPVGRTEMQRLSASAPRQRWGQPRGRMLLELPMLLEKARRLARIARATNAAGVSTFLNRSHTIALLAKMMFAPRLRIVINVHEMLSDHVDRHFSELERGFMRAFIRHGFPRAHRIVAVSDGVKQDLVRHFSIAPERIAVIPNPVDLDRIRRAGADAVEGDDASPLIVAVGRLVQLKGFDVLIRAFARLPASFGTRLLIVGEGDQRAALEQLIAELGVSDRATLLGTQTNPWKYMARADVVALASRSEAFPNVIGEALALARPVIATNCSPGVAEYLDDGRYGLLVPPDDVDALAAGLQRILTDEELRRQLTTRAPSRADSFGLSRVVERYEHVLADGAPT
jgi:N-acetylgalactosamine-N,N'-diacetylbacillosaminyl-diphospho-undecaprenol 4-alpha-N-acetylgalactosaminyltransferase